MSMFSNILVGYDGSKNAARAVEKAAEIAALCDAELSVLTIFRHYSMLEASLSMVRASDPGSIDDAMSSYAKETAEFGKAMALDHGAARARGFVKSGPPARTLIDFAEKHDVDLIVIGSRGLGSIENYLLGSVSHKVSGLASCPVLVV
ncbi:universal stress protein [Palleronia abyssalis]|uniref:TRAP-T-associated universal stress protein TeaD n=1 Tax=Palleronia abyssalis TaxID=1501240 RepID=A0A2R8BVG0_9RHOB|nr:universal stress protein [Palleronia abyssalis]SPJ24141.1 TRAP-T-associated universal stress protein TeaD [Palleronia abyssalis]